MPTSPQSTHRRCPSCGAEIDHLWYVADVTNWGWESGSCDLDGDNWEYDGDSETSDSQTDQVRYECPECNADIGTIENWEEQEEEEEEEEGPPPEPEPVDLEENPTSPLWRMSGKHNCMLFTCTECGGKKWLDEEEINDIRSWNFAQAQNPKTRKRKPTVICDKCLVEQVADANNTTEY